MPIIEISLRAVYLNSPYSKIWSAQGTIQNVPFHQEPVEPYDNNNNNNYYYYYYYYCNVSNNNNN